MYATGELEGVLESLGWVEFEEFEGSAGAVEFEMSIGVNCDALEDDVVFDGEVELSEGDVGVVELEELSGDVESDESSGRTTM